MGQCNGKSLEKDVGKSEKKGCGGKSAEKSCGGKAEKSYVGKSEKKGHVAKSEKLTEKKVKKAGVCPFLKLKK